MLTPKWDIFITPPQGPWSMWKKGNKEHRETYCDKSVVSSQKQ